MLASFQQLPINNYRLTVENFLNIISLLVAEDVNLNCRVFLWPKDMEAVIELAIQRLNMKRDQAEAILKNKRTQFDIRLRKNEKILNQFKKKDPPILTMEEMEEGVADVESLVERLAVRKHDFFLYLTYKI